MAMLSASTFFFRPIIGRRIKTPDGKTIGRITDLIADFSGARPKVAGAEIACRGGRKTIDFLRCRIARIKNKYSVTVDAVIPFDPGPRGTARLAGQLLGKQIIDTDSKKTVRVSDLMLASSGAGVFVVAVDAGIKGRLRRFGLDGPAERFLAFFGGILSNRLILWDNVETVGLGQGGAEITPSVSVLNQFHPSDMADIIEEMDPSAQVEVFSAMDTERAADVLEEMASDTRESLLNNLPPEKMADVLEIMPADEVADILDEVNEEKAEQLLQEMESEASGDVRDLMRYEDFETGSLMTTDFISFREQDTVQAALDILRREKPEADRLYNLFIISDKGELEASFTLRDMIVADTDARLRDISDRNVVYVHDKDRIEAIHDIIDKYNLLSVPVVDASKRMLGIVIINDVVFHLLHSRRRRP
jgi:magnesium transporter